MGYCDCTGLFLLTRTVLLSNVDNVGSKALIKLDRGAPQLPPPPIYRIGIGLLFYYEHPSMHWKCVRVTQGKHLLIKSLEGVHRQYCLLTTTIETKNERESIKDYGHLTFLESLQEGESVIDSTSGYVHLDKCRRVGWMGMG